MTAAAMTAAAGAAARLSITVREARRLGHVNVDVVKGHSRACRFRISALCTVGIECEHGFEVCPKCDPCTCDAGRA